MRSLVSSVSQWSIGLTIQMSTLSWGQILLRKNSQVVTYVPELYSYILLNFDLHSAYQQQQLFASCD